MSLADELLADLEEIGNDFDDDDDEEIKIKEEPIDGDEDDAHDAIEKMEIDDSVCSIISFVIQFLFFFCVFNGNFNQFQCAKISSIRSLCKLHDSQRLKRILSQINEYTSKPRNSNEIIGSVESDPEYQLIVEVNSIAVEMDNEICEYILCGLDILMKFVNILRFIF